MPDFGGPDLAQAFGESGGEVGSHLRLQVLQVLLFCAYLRSRMRTVSEIPHPLMRIHITSWNGKFALRFELDRYEQVFKVAEDDVSSLEEAERLAEALSEEVLLRFVAMRGDFAKTYKAVRQR